MAWDKGSPAPGIKAKQLDNDIRTNNDALEAAVDNEHDFSTSGTQTGDHTQGSARCFFQSAAPATRIDGSSFIEADNGSLWIDEDDNAFYIMTDYSEAVAADKWTPVSTEVIATLLAANRIFAGTLGVTGNFAVNTNKFTVDAATGNTAVSGTLDAATSIDIGSTVVVVGTIDDDTMAAATDTTLATSESIKAYIDSQMKVDDVAGATWGSGSESSTEANSKITKTGEVITGADSGTVTFDKPFPGGITSVQLTCKHNTIRGESPTYNTRSATAFTWFMPATNSGFSWTAIGY